MFQAGARRETLRKGGEIPLLIAGVYYQHPCAGVGLRLSGMSLEYATVIDTRNGLIHQLSVGIDL